MLPCRYPACLPSQATARLATGQLGAPAGPESWPQEEQAHQRELQGPQQPPTRSGGAPAGPELREGFKVGEVAGTPSQAEQGVRKEPEAAAVSPAGGPAVAAVAAAVGAAPQHAEQAARVEAPADQDPFWAAKGGEGAARPAEGAPGAGTAVPGGQL
jgi:hypothetical protein